MHTKQNNLPILYMLEIDSSVVIRVKFSYLFLPL